MNSERKNSAIYPGDQLFDLHACTQKNCSDFFLKLNKIMIVIANLCGPVGDISPQRGQPTFISIAGNKTCMLSNLQCNLIYVSYELLIH